MRSTLDWSQSEIFLVLHVYNFSFRVVRTVLKNFTVDLIWCACFTEISGFKYSVVKG